MPAINLKTNPTITADGDYYIRVSPGRPYTFRCYGDYGGGTLKAQDGEVAVIDNNSGTLTAAADIASATKTAAGVDVLRFSFTPVLPYINFNLASATAPSLKVVAVPEVAVRG